MTDGHMWFLAAFAFWSLPYCTWKSDGDRFGDSGGEASLSSRLFQLPVRLLSLTVAGRDKIAYVTYFPDYCLSMPTILIRLSIAIHLRRIRPRLNIRDGGIPKKLDWVNERNTTGRTWDPMIPHRILAMVPSSDACYRDQGTHRTPIYGMHA